jgi:serine/threonine protein kinase
MNDMDMEGKTIIKPLVKLRESLQPDAQFGQYHIVRLLGRGGMGEVYEAEHTTLGLRFALKLLPPDMLATPTALERFRREARVMAQLRHPHILHVDEFGETEGRFWFRMELANGATVKGRQVVSLAELAAAYGGRIEQGVLLGILQQLVAGLAHAHAKGVVHRDLKPANVLICTDAEGSVFKIADFGLVRLVGMDWLQSRVENSVRLTGQVTDSLSDLPTGRGPLGEGASTRSLLGTYEYMSPEQKRGEEVDARSDIYALGLMIFRLLTGDREWDLDEVPSQMVAGLVPAWDDLVKATLRARKEKRVADCAAMLPLLEAVAHGLGKPGTAGYQLRKPDSAQPDLKSPWTNSLGMEFAPVPGTQALFCKWLTRVQDFEAFVKATGHDATEGMHSLKADGWKQSGDAWESPGFEQGPAHPVCGVNWDDAQAFCLWLTQRERQAKRLKPEQLYRLPKDWEWSVAVGLVEPRTGTPKEKSEKIPDVYPWGREWPPPRGAGNFAGAEARGADWPPDLGVIAGYDDGFPRTSPVGSFAANQFGLFDMAGNLWEWCEDWSDGQKKTRVLRSGSWLNYAPVRLLSSFRLSFQQAYRVSSVGFRIVLAATP